MSSNISNKIDTDGFKPITNKKFNRLAKLEQDIKNLQKRIHSPKVDLVERDNLYLIRIELPGVDLNSISVQLKNSQIVLISGNKSINTVYESDRVVYRESKYDSFTRRVKLPGLVKSIEFNRNYVDFVNGVLNLTFEKDTSNTVSHVNNETSYTNNDNKTTSETHVTFNVSQNWADDI